MKRNDGRARKMKGTKDERGKIKNEEIEAWE